MSRVKLSYKSIAKGKMKSIYLEYNPSVKDSRGKRVRYECLNLEIYSNPNKETQIEYNRTIEDIAERIRCERYIKLVQHDFSFLPKARLDEDFLEYFRINGDCHGLSTKVADFISNSFVMVNATSKTSMPAYVTDFVYICFAERDCIIRTTDCPETLRRLTSMPS